MWGEKHVNIKMKMTENRYFPNFQAKLSMFLSESDSFLRLLSRELFIQVKAFNGDYEDYFF